MKLGAIEVAMAGEELVTAGTFIIEFLLGSTREYGIGAVGKNSLNSGIQST